jgi:hypothetical protein
MLQRFRKNDVVMVCSHLWRNSACRVRMQLPVGAKIDRFDSPTEFTRDDGSRGFASCTIRCAACRQVAQRRQIDYVETFWSDGRLVVADFAR